MRTAVYIKMDAHDQLLLSEGVCHQLGIVTYHPDVQRWRGGRRKTPTAGAEEAKSSIVQVQVVPHTGWEAPLCVEPAVSIMSKVGMQVEDALLQPDESSLAHVTISNPSSFSQVAAKGTCFGEASSVTLVDPDDYSGPDDSLLPADENTTMP